MNSAKNNTLQVKAVSGLLPSLWSGACIAI
jgi:hypothetical protein